MEEERKIRCMYCGHVTTIEYAKLPHADKLGECSKCGRYRWEYIVDDQIANRKS